MIDLGGYHESRRCSRGTYPESYNTKYTSTRNKLWGSMWSGCGEVSSARTIHGRVPRRLCVSLNSRLESNKEEERVVITSRLCSFFLVHNLFVSVSVFVMFPLVYCQIAGCRDVNQSKNGRGVGRRVRRLHTRWMRVVGSEVGSNLRLIDCVYHSTLGLRVKKKKKRMVGSAFKCESLLES